MAVWSRRCVVFLLEGPVQPTRRWELRQLSSRPRCFQHVCGGVTHFLECHHSQVVDAREGLVPIACPCFKGFLLVRFTFLRWQHWAAKLAMEMMGDHLTAQQPAVTHG